MKDDSLKSVDDQWKITLNEDEQLVGQAVEIAWRGRLSCTLDEIGAKLAFCKLFNVYPEFLGKTREGDPDCTVDGKRFNVRAAAPAEDAGLLVPCNEACEDVDIYALMIGRFPTYRYAGRITRKEMMKDEYLTRQPSSGGLTKQNCGGKNE